MNCQTLALIIGNEVWEISVIQEHFNLINIHLA